MVFFALLVMPTSALRHQRHQMFSQSRVTRRNHEQFSKLKSGIHTEPTVDNSQLFNNAARCARNVFAGFALLSTVSILNPSETLTPLYNMLTVQSAAAAVDSTDQGANDLANAKIKKGGASTLQQGISKSITRGVNLDGSDFHGQNLKGVAFQQSIVRDANFRDTNLYSASFFDATLDGSDFENADMTLANIELAQFNRANLKNTILKEAYVVGTTQFEGVASIENSDWTDCGLNKYQRKLLCGLPSAKGTNSKTGADTRESLLCED